MVYFHTFVGREISSSEATRDLVAEIICGLAAKGSGSQSCNLSFVIPQSRGAQATGYGLLVPNAGKSTLLNILYN